MATLITTMIIADAFSSPEASWNLVQTTQALLEYPYMQHALVAGALVAAMTGVVGWFMVLRSQAYAGHTLSLVGFPGAAGAVLVGAPALAGFFVSCTLAALCIAKLSPDQSSRRAQSATVATIQAFALGLGLLFVSCHDGFLNSTTSFLFGSFTGVTTGEVTLLAMLVVVVLLVMAAVARPLLFASVDPSVASARGVPVALLSVVFLLVLGLAVAGTSQFTGSLLVFSLLVAPPAAAQLLVRRPVLSVVAASLLAVFITWGGLATAYFTEYPVGFLIATYAVVVYLIARVVNSLRSA